MSFPFNYALLRATVTKKKKKKKTKWAGRSISFKIACAPRNDSNKPPHLHRLIRVFVACLQMFWVFGYHYENTPIQIYRTFYLQKLKQIRIKTSDIFHISAQNIDCWYSLEPPRRGGFNEYHNLCFWAEIRKIMFTPVNPSFTT